MAKGLSFHFGLNSVDPAHYQGWDGQLNACEMDANDMELLASSQGFKTKKFLTKQATRKNLITALTGAAKALKSGDACFITYSGHGGQLPDVNGDEDDGEDETWCLYDGQFVDDETYALLGKFKPGVRILVLSDSCHSGSATRDAMIQHTYVATMLRGQPAQRSVASPPVLNYRAMPRDVATRVYLANKAMYDKILKDKSLDIAPQDIAAPCILISGCQDNQLSGDGAFNGVFTGCLKRVWNGGKFSGDYRAFCKAIKAKMPPDQTPNLFPIGAGVRDFEKQKPFTI